MTSSSAYAKICILSLTSFEDKLFTYAVPENMQADIRRGSVVIAPFGNSNRSETAVVFELCDKTEFEATKSLISFYDSDIYLNDELFSVCTFLKNMCFCSLASAIKTILPPGVKMQKNVYYSVSDGIGEESLIPLSAEMLCIYNYIKQKKAVSLGVLKSKFSPADETAEIVDILFKKGFIERQNDYKKTSSKKTELRASLLISESDAHDILLFARVSFSEAQRKVISYLCDVSEASSSDISETVGVTPSVLKTLQRKGIISLFEGEIERNPYGREFISSIPKNSFTLSEEQSGVSHDLIKLLSDNSPRAALLYGVTGSGKTNVMLSVIDEALTCKKGVLVLIPEISLTAQTVSIFASHYGERISVLHSRLSVGERRDAFCRISSGESDIVIGTRSAIFAPVKNLGLIVIDEEQENSFKSDMTPKYHARDIARFRCAKNNALLLLCSATPSVESMYKAKNGVYSLFTLKNRYGNAVLPTVTVTDMRTEEKFITFKNGDVKPNLIGKRLYEEIDNNTHLGEQTILFMNRRGFSSFSLCRKCGNVIKCPNCSVSLTYHRHRHKEELLCHYCGYSIPPKKLCEVCGSEYIDFMGSGTELLEDSLHEQFHYSKVLRMDADTTSGKLSHDIILNKFRRKEADILVGTQMVAKGHDFPYVSLVGVINAEGSLFLDDYRANERTFSLITQVIGRAGRAAVEGRAIIQTFNPENETVLQAKNQDYDAFYESEILLRKKLLFPPFCDILVIKFISDTEGDAKSYADKFGAELKRLCDGEYRDVKMILYGPFEDSIFKLAGKYRMKYVIKCKNTKRLRELFLTLKNLAEEYYSVLGTISLDMNPTVI